VCQHELVGHMFLIGTRGLLSVGYAPPRSSIGGLRLGWKLVRRLYLRAPGASGRNSGEGTTESVIIRVITGSPLSTVDVRLLPFSRLPFLHF